jgi:hypothetical protein
MVDIKDLAHRRLSETDLTVQELMDLVEKIVSERLQANRDVERPHSGKASAEWWQAMVSEIIVPTPGTPSATAMLREERDQWYKPS